MLSVAAIVLALLGGGWYLMHLSGQVATQRAIAQQATQVAAANAQSLRDMEAAKARADAQVADMVKVTEERTTQLNALRRKVLDAKDSSACIGSASVRVLLDGLRLQSAPGTDGGAHH